MPQNYRQEYVSRINKVLDFIEKNLDRPLNLDTLADKAHFSPFYFHRIFRSIVGETVNSFIQRLRIERAAAQLTANKKKSIIEIAMDCGFSGSSVFARAFKEYYGISASEWKRNTDLTNSKISIQLGKERKYLAKDCKEVQVSSVYFAGVHNKFIWRIQMVDKSEISVEVKELPEIHLAYVRNIGPYKGNPKLFEKLFNQLVKWAGPRGLVNFPETKFICVYHDNPDITDENKLRLSAALTIKADTEVSGEVGKMSIPAGKYAIAHFELRNNEYEQAWNMVCGDWLPNSGYEPADGPCFEIYLNDPKTHPEGKCIVDICVPVKPL